MPDDTQPDRHWRDLTAERHHRLFGGHYPYADVGDGWAAVVLDLLAAIDAIVPPGDDGFRVTDIKSKYAGLRCYHTGGEDVEELVDRADERASRTCETCGAPGTARGRGWVVVACDAHAPREGGAS